MTTPKMTLGEAASQNSMRIVRQLIEAGADPNVSEDGLVPLREACFSENIPMIKYLLEHGANPNGRDPDDDETVLESYIHHCYKHVNTAVLRRLLRAGADPNLRKAKELRPMFQWAIFNNIKRLVSILLKYGADVNQRGQVHNGETPLMIAAYYADISIMEKLLACGADVNAKDEEGWNALFYVVAGMCPWQEILPRFKLLFKYGIDLHARTKHGKYILQHGRRLDNATIHWLRSHGVNV